VSAASVQNGSAELPPNAVEAGYRQTTILIGAIGVSIVILIAAVLMLNRTLPAPVPGPAFTTLRLVLFAVAGVVVFVSTILKVVVLRKAPAHPLLRLSRLKSAAVMSAAMAEIPAILGFTLYIMGRGLGDFFVLAAISVYMLVRHFPRRAFWDEYVRLGPSGGVR